MSNSLFYVYHIKLPHHDLDEGYVGISINPKERWRQHKKRNKGKNSVNPILTSVFKKYKDQLLFEILSVHTSVDDALWEEYTLRPQKEIGWNIAIGGAKCPMHGIGGHSEATRKKMSKSHTGKKIPPEVVAKMVASRKLTPTPPWTEERKKAISGLKNHKSKPVNLYCYHTDNLLYENVVIRQWAKEHNFSHSTLGKTLRADHSKPSTKYNVRHCKGIYARYVVDVEKENHVKTSNNSTRTEEVT